MDDDVPERVWTGKEVPYKLLRVFGCRAYVHVRKMKNPSLMTNANHTIFFGGFYHEEFGYILYDLEKKVIRNRDVVFLEEPNEIPNFTHVFQSPNIQLLP